VDSVIEKLFLFFNTQLVKLHGAIAGSRAFKATGQVTQYPSLANRSSKECLFLSMIGTYPAINCKGISVPSDHFKKCWSLIYKLLKGRLLKT